MCVFFLHFTLNLLMKSIRNSSIRLLNSSIIIFVVSNISAPIVEIYVKNSIGCNLNKRLFCEWNKWTEDWTEEGILWFSVSSTSDKWVNHKQWTSIRVKIFFFLKKKNQFVLHVYLDTRYGVYCGVVHWVKWKYCYTFKHIHFNNGNLDFVVVHF